MADLDASNRLLFSHRRMARDVLEFVDQEWVRQVRPESLERYSESQASESLHLRHEDLVWKARWRSGPGSVYIPIEFQSTVDRWMGLRMANYSGLLSQGLVNSRQLDHPRRLPPVFPLVWYNGSDRWTAPLEVSKLYENMSRGLEKHALRLRYYLLDSQRYPPEDLEGRRNAVACLWRLENCQRPEDLARVIDDLMRWFPGHRYQAMRRNFGLWLQRVLLPRNFPGVDLPGNLPDLMEAKPMLVERVEEWKQEWKEEGLRVGKLQGLREGIQKGESHLLIRLLEHKFGSLSKQTRQQVAEADSPALREWTFKALDSNGLEQVFNGGGAKEAG